jgi:hypothetical protein
VCEREREMRQAIGSLRREKMVIIPTPLVTTEARGVAWRQLNDRTYRATERKPITEQFIIEGKQGMQVRGIQFSKLVADLLVATVLPLALLPVVLEVLHLGAVLGVAAVIKGVFETALAALAQAEDEEGCDGKYTCSGCATVDSDVGSLAQIVPFFGQGLGRGFVEFCESGRVSTGRRVSYVLMTCINLELT